MGCPWVSRRYTWLPHGQCPTLSCIWAGAHGSPWSPASSHMRPRGLPRHPTRAPVGSRRKTRGSPRTPARFHPGFRGGGHKILREEPYHSAWGPVRDMWEPRAHGSRPCAREIPTGSPGEPYLAPAGLHMGAHGGAGVAARLVAHVRARMGACVTAREAAHVIARLIACVGARVQARVGAPVPRGTPWDPTGLSRTPRGQVGRAHGQSRAFA